MVPKQVPTPLPLGWLQDVVNVWRETGGERMLHLASQLEIIIAQPMERTTRTHNLIKGKPARIQPDRRKYFNTFQEYLDEPSR